VERGWTGRPGELLCLDVCWKLTACVLYHYITAGSQQSLLSYLWSRHMLLSFHSSYSDVLLATMFTLLSQRRDDVIVTVWQCCWYWLWVVQRWLRARLERRRYVQMLRGFCRLQLMAREWLARHSAVVVVIQSVVRMWSARRHVAYMNRSAVIIQVIHSSLSALMLSNWAG